MGFGLWEAVATPPSNNLDILHATCKLPRMVPAAGPLAAPAVSRMPGAHETAFLRPASWSEALDIKAEHPDYTPICGGTDLLVELNFARVRPRGLIDLSRIDELGALTRDDGHVALGAGVTYSRIERELATDVTALAMAARTVGSPQIRNRGTVGGNLATASPAGDAHPPLLALGADVEADSVDGTRIIPIDEFFVGPKRNALQPIELIRSVRLPSNVGPQQFSKIGSRNAMVIATVSFALAVHEAERRLGTGIGSAGPTPLRAVDAEVFVAEHLQDRWDDPAALDDAVVSRFGQLVGGAARPIDDVRGSADYRRHALGVLAERCLRWCWHDHFPAGVGP
jgi:CO/xanthine dehydrogenase FAD-binding subunit